MTRDQLGVSVPIVNSLHGRAVDKSIHMEKHVEWTKSSTLVSTSDEMGNFRYDSQDFHDSDGCSLDPHDKQMTPLRCAEDALRDVLSGPLREYLPMALELGKIEAEAANAEDGRWQSPLFSFVRYAKAHHELHELSGEEALERVREAMEDCGNSPFASDRSDMEDNETDFLESWEKARHVPFQAPMQRALTLAKAHPFRPVRERTGLYGLFLSVVAALHEFFPSEPVVISLKAFANLLGKSEKTVSTLRRWAEEDGHLALVEKYRFAEEGKRNKAATYQFIPDPRDRRQ